MLASEQVSKTKTTLNLSVLGGFSITGPEHADVRVTNKKACALLAYLALKPNRSETREKLAGLLWSDRTETQARASLRQCLKQLRIALEAIEFNGFVTARNDVSLPVSQISVDIEEVSKGVEVGEVSDLLLSVECSPEKILYGFEALDSSFGAWLHVVRQKWQEKIVDQLQTIMREWNPGPSRLAAEALVNLDPTHEEAQRSLIRRYADDGNTAAALRQYNSLWQLLDDEYDMEPDDETVRLIAEVKGGTYKRGVTGPVAQAGGVESYRQADAKIPLRLSHTPETGLPIIGIAPFAVGGPTEVDGYILEGFRRELIASMVRFREWVVIELDETALITADLVAANYKLEGVYVKESNDIRLVVTLKDLRSQRFIWSEQLVVNHDSWFAAQQGIVRRISLTLDVYLSAERLSQLGTGREFSNEIYDQWLGAHHLLQYWNPENELSAESKLSDLISKAPQFSRPYSSLATIYNTKHIRAPGSYHMPDDSMAALSLAQKAVQLDPLDTRNQMTLAWSYIMKSMFDQAELHLNLTTELNPNSPTTLVPTAHGLSYCGKYAEALELAETAIDLHPALPQFHWGFVACIQFFNHNFDKSADAAEKAHEAIADIKGWKAAALAHAGRVSEAQAAAAEFVELMKQRWIGSDNPDDAEIVRWFLSAFPIREKAALGLLREGLIKAGLPNVEIAER